MGHPSSAISIKIRHATRNDLDHVVAFNLALAQETEGRLLEECLVREGVQALSDNPSQGFYLVAEIQEGEKTQIVGQLMITYEWSDWRNGVFWWIQSVYVHPGWRKKGIFRHLFEFIRREAKARRDVVGLRLYVEEQNSQAMVIYQKLGLIPTPYQVFEQDFVLHSKESMPSR